MSNIDDPNIDRGAKLSQSKSKSKSNYRNSSKLGSIDSQQQGRSNSLEPLSVSKPSNDSSILPRPITNHMIISNQLAVPSPSLTFTSASSSQSVNSLSISPPNLNVHSVPTFKSQAGIQSLIDSSHSIFPPSSQILSKHLLKSMIPGMDAMECSPPVSPLKRKEKLPIKNNFGEMRTNKVPLTSQILSMSARKENDSMIYLEGPQIYTCGHCRTHLTSHDDIISKSFHGRHGRAYLFDNCVNVTNGPVEDRRLITGMHSVCDIICKRCKTIVGWTYVKAYETSQKYKEGKFIIEKINLHMEESDYYDFNHPAGERRDRWKLRSMSWGSESSSLTASPRCHTEGNIVYEYKPTNSSEISSPHHFSRSGRSRSDSFNLIPNASVTSSPKSPPSSHI